MKIQNISNTQNFRGLYDVTRYQEDPNLFYRLNKAEKLDVIFDILCEQNKELKNLKSDVYQHSKNLNKNQDKIQKFVKYCFQIDKRPAEHTYQAIDSAYRSDYQIPKYR